MTIVIKNHVAAPEDAPMRHRVFGRTGLRVSTLALGAGTFGTRWGYGSEPDEARAVFDAYRAAGGDFSDELVLATKFARGAAAASGIQSVGNSRKVMIQAVEGSLKRLRTDRIDLLWVHMPDGVTPVDEIVRGLDDLVRAGKIIYAGFSDFPAWRVAAAATLADLRGWAPIAGIQIEYSLVERTPERELLPMAVGFGLGVTGWSPLGGGLLTGKYRRGETGRAQRFGRVIHGESDASKTAAVDAVLAIAEATGATPSQVAIAWVLAKGVLPIIGPRTPAQLADNLAAAALVLTDEQITQLDAASAIPLGFPHEMLASSETRTRLAGGHPELIDAYAGAIR
jgi:aryl-alcohol dehydrogenase-like predicted oxidoreductase